ncbi:MAG TPA: hypothetical protein VE242_04805 [Chthoniobacterales bacterium]|nr:hypothetical protein [Chthoniobacterales bacterium]
MRFASYPGLAVLNAQGRDPDQSFAGAFPSRDSEGHPPINYHAYAACTRGAFYRDTALASRHRNVLMLLRSDLRIARKAFGVLKAKGCVVAIAFKEAGAHQVAQQLSDPKTFSYFGELAAQADLCLSSTPDLVPLFSCFSRRVVYLPTPYPVDYPAWNLAVPIPERSGIFLGTREFSVPSRNHLLALGAARLTSFPVTVIDEGTATTKSLLQSLRYPPEQLTILHRMPYSQYLEVLRRHRIVLQFDQSRVPGQVAGDALLCRVPTVGGNGAIEREVLGDLNGDGRSFSELVQIALRLLRDDHFYTQQVEQMNSVALDKVSFGSIQAELIKLFPGIDAN